MKTDNYKISTFIKMLKESNHEIPLDPIALKFLRWIDISFPNWDSKRSCDIADLYQAFKSGSEHKPFNICV